MVSWLKLIIDPKLKGNIRAYFVQCGLATLALLIVIIVQDSFDNVVIIAAVASTAFILFITPHASMCNPRRVIGGHAVALAIGGAMGVFIRASVGGSVVGTVPYSFEFLVAIAVGLAILIMAFTNTEHGPAAGTALGMAVLEFNWSLVIVVLVSAVILSVVHQLALRRMRDLI